MRQFTHASTFVRCQLAWINVALVVLPIAWLQAAPPGWWSQRGATNSSPADDYAAANIGQLKHFATKAAAELNARLPGGAGPQITVLLTTWQHPPAQGTTRDDFAALTVGQLKTVAKPFYDRLIAAQHTTTYPWTTSPADDDNSAIANLGQLKTVFAFDLTAPTGQLPSWWQRYYFDGQTGISPSADSDGDGLTNLQEFIYHSDPMDFGNLATNALQDSDGNDLPDWWEILNFGTLGNDPNQIVPGNGGLTLQQIYDNDLDVGVSATLGDGIPDSWKIANGLSTTDPDVANKDPDSDGLTNAEEFEAGTNPNNAYSDRDTFQDGRDLYPLVADPTTPTGFYVAIPTREEQLSAPRPDWSAVDYTSVELRWEASTNDPANYVIERRGDNDLWQPVAMVSGSATTHEDAALVANRYYQYRIRAVKPAGGTQVSSGFATTSYRVPINLRIHQKVATSFQEKLSYGYPEFTSPSNPPKFYLTRTDISSYSDPGSSSMGNYYLTRTNDPMLKTEQETGSYFNSRSPGQSETSSYSSLYQARSPGVLAGIEQHYFSYTSDSPSVSSGSSGNFLLQSTYSPVNGPAFWAGSDYQMSLGTVSYSGSSTYSSYYNPNGNNSNRYSSATLGGLSDSQWVGTSTDSRGNTTPISYAPYRSGWEREDWFGSLQSTTQTQKTYSQTSGSNHYQGTQTLSDEYTTSALVATTIAHMSDYPPEWTEYYWASGYYPWASQEPSDYWDFEDWYFFYGHTSYSWSKATVNWNLSDDQEALSTGRFKYKFSANPSAPKTMRWAEIFVPYDDTNTPEVNESLDIEVVAERTWQLTGSANESSEFEIDPTQNPPNRNGYYTILLRPASISVPGVGEAGKDITGQDTEPGKVVLINDGDADNDGIPDYADGYNLHSAIETDDACEGASFIPVHVGFYAVDPRNAKVKFTYAASNPTAVTSASTNPYQLPTTGKIRLWMKDTNGGWDYDPATGESEFSQRDGRSISQGGHFIESGAEYTLEDLGIDPNYYYYNHGAGFTVYAEIVKTSDAVADIPVKVEIKPNGNLGFVFSDQVRFTGVATEVLSSSINSDDFSPASMVSPSRFRLQELIDNPTGNALPQTALFKIRITDPRSSLNNVMIGQQMLSLSPIQVSRHITAPFIFTTPGAVIPSAFAQYTRILYSNINAVVDYNPQKSFSNIKFPELPKEMQQTYSDMQRVAKQMHDAGWQPPVGSEGDTGIFGKGLHQRMSQEYANKRGRLPDVWLDADGKVLGFNQGYEWRPPGSTTGTTQIDLLIVKGGYKPTVGRELDRSRLITVVDFKASGRVKWGDVNADFATRIKTHTGMDLWAPVSEYRYNFTSQAMEAGKNIRRTTKLLKGINVALPLATLMALPHVAAAMDNAVDKTQTFIVAHQGGGGDPFQAQLEMALSIKEILSLLSLSPVQEYGNYYAALSLAVLDVATLFEHDSEYD